MRRVVQIFTVALVLLVPGSAVAASSHPIYLSLGDSWSQGEQPVGPGQADVPTKSGFADVLTSSLRTTVPGLRLVKLGCGRATTHSMIYGRRRCTEKMPYRNASPATAQLAYATRFLHSHRGQVALISVVIGGNDVAACGAKPTVAEILACVKTGEAAIKHNLPRIVAALRRAAGPRVTIVGLTYADVVLGQYVKGSQGRLVAQASVGVFHDQLNPVLKSIYAARNIGFVDATAGFGGYIPMSQTTTLAPYGTLPIAVARICTLAWYCAVRKSPDIHLRTVGYRLLATLVRTQVQPALIARYGHH